MIIRKEESLFGRFLPESCKKPACSLPPTSCRLVLPAWSALAVVRFHQLLKYKKAHPKRDGFQGESLFGRFLPESCKKPACSLPPTSCRLILPIRSALAVVRFHQLLKYKKAHPKRDEPFYMPEGGIEPPRHCWHRILSPARLPVPPFRLQFIKKRNIYYFNLSFLSIKTKIYTYKAPICL